MPGIVTDAALLAGGKGSRLLIEAGGEISGKLQADLMGASMVSMSHMRLARIFPAPFVVAPAGMDITLPQSYRMLADEPVGTGPAAGIAAAVRNSSDWCFVAAADMPFLDDALIMDFRDSVERLSDGALCAIPCWSKGLEPLHAFYRRGSLDIILKFLGSGERSLINLSQRLSAVRLDAQAAASRTRSDLSIAFFNVNTAADLEEAREIIRQREEKP